MQVTSARAQLQCPAPTFGDGRVDRAYVPMTTGMQIYLDIVWLIARGRYHYTTFEGQPNVDGEPLRRKVLDLFRRNQLGDGGDHGVEIPLTAMPACARNALSDYAFSDEDYANQRFFEIPHNGRTYFVGQYQDLTGFLGGVDDFLQVLDIPEQTLSR
jgi:hypothetical protein